MSDKLRLLICKSCPSVEELPWYEGPPQHDYWLNRMVATHTDPSGLGHIGQLATVSVSDWNNKQRRNEILKEIYTKFSLPGAGAGLGDEYYDTKNNFLDDAFLCWKRFNRPTDPSFCDYRKDNKRLLPDTKADRKEAGMSSKDRPNTFLCDFCPVQSLVMQKKRQAAGQYN